jgi:hypothetical protein
MNRNTFCDYHEGMFACESWSKIGATIPEYDVASEAVSFHESGHAVLQYALGLGCAGITLISTRIRRGDTELDFKSGACAADETTDRRVRAQIDTGKFSFEVLAHGIATAAGPAAERKYYLLHGLPFRMLGATGADRHSIDSTDLKLASNGGKRFAYRRLVWRHAQLALEQEAIWSAVRRVAGALKTYWPEIKKVGEKSSVMHGDMVQALIRRSGVTAGSIAPLLTTTRQHDRVSRRF